MKLVKKIISAVAAVAMTVSAFSAMTVQAAGAELKITATPDVDKNYVELKISYSGATGGKNNAFGMDINLSNEYFELTEFIDMEWDMRDTVEEEKTTTTDLVRKQYRDIKIKHQNDNLNLMWSSSDTTAYLAETVDNLLTFRAYVKDGANSPIWTEGYEFNFNAGTTTLATFNPGLGTLSLVNASIEAAGGNNEPEITKVGSYADGANDNAVAYMYETTAVAGNTVTATGTITFADDTTKTATLSKAVNANVEGAVALGIIVQFDGTWKDFVITEMAIN